MEIRLFYLKGEVRHPDNIRRITIIDKPQKAEIDAAKYIGLVMFAKDNPEGEVYYPLIESKEFIKEGSALYPIIKVSILMEEPWWISQVKDGYYSQPDQQLSANVYSDNHVWSAVQRVVRKKHIEIEGNSFQAAMSFYKGITSGLLQPTQKSA